MLRLTFPCTTNGGNDPGKPCMFPYKDYYNYDDDSYDYVEEYLQYACVKMQTTSPACYTRLTANQTIYKENDVQEFWGYCPENCNGEKANPESKYNLANNEFAQLWESEFYDLRTWESGLCHTYNPPHKSEQGFNNRLFFMLGHENSEANKRMMFGFEIFIHEKDQF